MRDGDLPRSAGAEHLAPQQLGEQSAADQRTLAASGGADHGDEAVVPQACEELERLFFAAEEQVVLFLGERPQSGEGVRLVHVHASLTWPMKASSSALGANSLAWRMTPAWCER